MRLQDQVILITGSTTGIGEHMARRFIREGARVILHGRGNGVGVQLLDKSYPGPPLRGPLTLPRLNQIRSCLAGVHPAD